MPTITVKKTVSKCYLRGLPIEVKTLTTRTPLSKYIYEVPAGTSVEVVKELSRKGQYIQYETKNAFAGETNWWIYAPYWDLPAEPAQKGSVHLEVPFRSQRDNEYNPGGSCNVTSIAMALLYLGQKEGEMQLEDELYQACLDNGLSRHDPVDLAALVHSYGYKDNYKQFAKWEDVKKHLSAGNPCVVHSYLVRPFGHIVTIIGYNEQGWIVHDPWGEWHSWGYEAGSSGASLTYSYNLMNEVCSPDGELWMHFISK